MFTEIMANDVIKEINKGSLLSRLYLNSAFMLTASGTKQH